MHDRLKGKRAEGQRVDAAPLYTRTLNLLFFTWLGNQGVNTRIRPIKRYIESVTCGNMCLCWLAL